MAGLADGFGVPVVDDFAGRGLVDDGDTASQQAVFASRVEVGEQHGYRLPDDPATVCGGTVAQQGKPGVLEVKQFLGRQVDGDLLGVLLPAAGQALVAAIWTGSSRSQEFRDPGQAYPP
jgi:hypothetical protein